MYKLRVIELSGSPYAMGQAHGQRFHDEIHMFTEERVKLCQDRRLDRSQPAARSRHGISPKPASTSISFTRPSSWKKCKAWQTPTGLSVAELVINNGFTDFIDVVYNLGAELQPAAPALYNDNLHRFSSSRLNAGVDDKAFFGQTWDMHATATPYVHSAARQTG